MATFDLCMVTREHTLYTVHLGLDTCIPTGKPLRHKVNGEAHNEILFDRNMQVRQGFNIIAVV